MNSAQKKIVAIFVPVLVFLIGATVLSPPESDVVSLNYYFHSYGILRLPPNLGPLSKVEFASKNH